MGADGSFGTSAIITNSRRRPNILIQDNLLAGGAYALYCDSPGAGTNYRVIDNHFSRKFSPKVGFFGAVDRLRRRDTVRQRLPRNGRPLRLG